MEQSSYAGFEDDKNKKHSPLISIRASVNNLNRVQHNIEVDVHVSRSRKNKDD